MKMNRLFFTVILKGTVLLSSKKMAVKSLTLNSLFRPSLKVKKRKLLLEAYAGNPAEESSDSASYANVSRNTENGGTYSLSTIGYGAKRVSAGSASYANGPASAPIFK